jgi:hypothetical protein
MRTIQDSQDSAARFITAGMAMRFAITLADDEMSTAEAREVAETLLVTLKLARRRSVGPALVVDALVTQLLPHFSEGFPDDLVENDGVLPPAVALAALKLFSDHCDQGKPLDELVDAANWIPSIVALAVNTLSDVTGRHAN